MIGQEGSQGNCVTGDNSVSIVWFRGHDLRVEDNHALSAAVERGCGILPLFIWDEELLRDAGYGNWWKWWLFTSLRCLHKQILKLGNRLVFLEGNIQDTLVSLVQKVGADAIFWNRDFDPSSMSLDRKVIEKMKMLQLKISIHEGNAWSRQWERIDNQQTKCLPETFSGFMKLWVSSLRLKPIDKPKTILKPIIPHMNGMKIFHLDDSERENEISTTTEAAKWSPGCVAAKYALKKLQIHHIINYSENYFRKDMPIWSQFSPYVRFGEITSHQVYHELNEISESTLNINNSSLREYPFLRNLCLRDFFRYLFIHHPELSRSSFMEYFSRFPSKFDKYLYDSFVQGQTGYPIIDAAVRALRFRGWIHTCLRSLLVKFFVFSLMLPSEILSHWFYSSFIDAEFYTNTVFIENTLESSVRSSLNNITYHSAASRRIDPLGKFIKRWVSELSKMDSRYIHSPWKASKDYLNACSVKLGISYPYPIIYPRLARKRARDAIEFFQELYSLQKIGRMLEDRNFGFSRRRKRSYKYLSNPIESESSKCRRTCRNLSSSKKKTQQFDRNTLQLNKQHNNNTCNAVIEGTPILKVSCYRQHLHISSPSATNACTVCNHATSPSERSPWLSVFDNWNMEGMTSPEILSPSFEFISSLFYSGDVKKNSNLFNTEDYESPHILWSPKSRMIPKSPIRKYKEYSLLSIDISLPKQHPVYSYDFNDVQESVPMDSSLAQPSNVSPNESIVLENQNDISPSESSKEQHSFQEMNREEKRQILENISQDSASVFCTLARFILLNYNLTECSSRECSKDFERLRNIKNVYDSWKPAEAKSLKLHQMKHFFGNFLKLDVSDERDRHYHGGIRGPYVYGIKRKLTR
ncbi:deoxyribodipyrimidine photo-lyase / cryptochrome [Galdieria sulphuraria]|uniref:Deoxyribodipyrimidine photo-lyase / cryptochrome n=1 Tax=Galdieria sulphuraria TaxID=130081 RepID=M2W8G4_GALSU|nr:deoxyribodipyrimidine photo-lyase / cryptochrome [Galdieria sulphuraria]EME32171.1 deoxyribodipyrimidine photo-lyase / cryptochrome [Galdieria sulphuraria]|eukprot:XP_005708691.1 deoxyribodipyrimidine photo-lyase / cryptochrome [Galdieria sulphuraria]